MANGYGESESDMKLAKYNSALPQIWRIDNLWKEVSSNAINIRYAKLNEILDRAWLELYVGATKEQKEQMMDIDDKLEKLKIYSLTPKLKKTNVGLFAKTIRFQKKYLQEKEKLIREVEDKSGKGAAYVDHDEDDFE